jgi:hypothetical protein
MNKNIHVFDIPENSAGRGTLRWRSLSIEESVFYLILVTSERQESNAAGQSGSGARFSGL